MERELSDFIANAEEKRKALLERRKLDAVEQPLSDRLQVSALSLAQRSLIYDARQSA